MYICFHIYGGWGGLGVKSFFFLAIWKTSLIQLNHRLLVFISLPAALLPSVTQPGVWNLQEVTRDPASCHIQFLLLIRPWSTTETVRKIHYLGHNCRIY